MVLERVCFPGIIIYHNVCPKPTIEYHYQHGIFAVLIECKLPMRLLQEVNLHRRYIRDIDKQVAWFAFTDGCPSIVVSHGGE